MALTYSAYSLWPLRGSGRAGLFLVAALVMACSPSPEDAVMEAGGKSPVRCLRPDSGFTFCRDGDRAIFICRGNRMRCVSVDRVRAVLGDMLERDASGESP